MRVIINTTDLNTLGGVSSYYKGLKKHLPSSIKYNTIGSRNGINGLVLMPFDIIKTLLLILKHKPIIAVLNPSMKFKAFYRDLFYLHLYHLFGIKTIVFFHGWDNDFENKISLNPSIINGFKKRALTILVLSKKVQSKLRKWGFNQNIYLVTTKVSNDLLKGFDISRKEYDQPKLLFLSRIDNKKGIYQAIKSFILLKNNHPNLKFSIVGKGKEFIQVQKYISSRKIKDITIHGRLEGIGLAKILNWANIYIFPSTYEEGMPATVLEAMGFGCSVVTSISGGLVDVFKHKINGFTIDPLNVNDISEKIELLLMDKKLRKTIGYYNHNYVKEKFLADSVAKRLIDIFTIELNNAIKI